MHLALCSSLVMRVLPTWLGCSADLAVMLPAAAKSAAAFLATAFSLLILFLSITGQEEDQQGEGSRQESCC